MHNPIYFLITFLFNSNLSPSLIKLIIPLVAVLIFCTAITTITANAASGKQLLIGSNINTIDAFGKYNDTAYTNFYNVRNLFDNQTNSWSFWSQYGKSGFVISLNPIDKPVCSVEIDVNNPKNTPFNLRLGNPETFINFNGKLDNQKEILEINDCIKDVKAISMTFDADNPKKWTTLSEIKLFSNGTNIPPVEPPTCQTGYHWDPVKKACVPDIVNPPGGGNQTNITINNSTALIDVTNSKLVLNIDADTEIVENHQSSDDNDEEENEEDEN